MGGYPWSYMFFMFSQVKALSQAGGYSQGFQCLVPS